jgi:hypothetical protein
MWHPVTLSNKMRKNADRVGGIELMLPWPEDLPFGPALRGEGYERDASPAEKAAAEQILGAACAAVDLVIVHVRVALVRRPWFEVKNPGAKPPLPRMGAVEQHLAVTIIGRRWVDARTQSPGVERWHPIERIARADRDPASPSA